MIISDDSIFKSPYNGAYIIASLLDKSLVNKKLLFDHGAPINMSCKEHVLSFNMVNPWELTGCQTFPGDERAFWLMTLAAFYTFAEAAGLALPRAVLHLLHDTILSLQCKVRHPCSAERWSRGNGAKWFETSCVVGEKTPEERCKKDLKQIQVLQYVFSLKRV